MPRLRSARRAPLPPRRAPRRARPTPRLSRLPRSAHVAGAAAAVLALSVAAASCAVPGQGGSAAAADPAAELVLQPVADRGHDPFTPSTATPDGAAPSPSRTAAPPDSPPPAEPSRHQSVSGGKAGLYGGVRNVASCDVDKQIAFLGRDADKQAAFARTLRVDEGDLPGFLRELTSVLLRADTRLTGHGFADGEASPFQSVLQAGTAVMVDDKGVPRVRCASGSPLTAPEKLSGNDRYGGTGWRGFRPSRTVVVTPAQRALSRLVIVDVNTDLWFERPVGARPGEDRKLPQPPRDHFNPPAPSRTHSPSAEPTGSPGPTTEGPSEGPGTESGEPSTAPPLPGGIDEEEDHERVSAGESAGAAASAG
ncbi:DUF6777 domain-containing protein [Streptomyces sp. CMB-StM0423]|uniref:DUF6777 domain-containing protein n=1 Tax=Streptomyces sp. CMB-StM0423 TaxID=2059884 RepID=UPI000C70E698|nr:DUF6777 domain-containing protein [Streptomyces sp. CMB-StM0423]AUH43860.1 hypothetical protein CXR04_30080 [Streptomyces sp. CMB-StM0423]